MRFVCGALGFPLLRPRPVGVARVFFFRATAVVLAALLFGNSVAAAAGVPKDRKAMDPMKLKQALIKRGIGRGVQLKLLDGTTDVGILTAIHDDGCELIPKKEIKPITVSYGQVAGMRNDGMSTGAKVAIGVVVGVVIAAGVIAIIAYEGLKGLKRL